MTLLSNAAILRHRNHGSIVIEPFDEKALGNVSFDLTLGEKIARYRARDRVLDLESANPADAFEVEKAKPHPRAICPKCGPCRPVDPLYSFVVNREVSHCHNCWSALLETSLGFELAAGERVLAHSREMAGGRCVPCPACSVFPNRNTFDDADVFCSTCHNHGALAVTSQLHATSTAARIGLQVCGCAGWGDVGFVSPWVFEITNLSPLALWIPVGAVVAQISFEQVEPPLRGTSYEKIGTYQKTADVEEIRRTWKFEDVLPRPLKVRP